MGKISSGMLVFLAAALLIAIIYRVFTFEVSIQPQALPPSGGQTELALRAEIEQMRVYQEQLLQTVFWALGSLVSLGAILVGFGWFANFRFYDRDKEALKREMNDLIDREFQRIVERNAISTREMKDVISSNATENIDRKMARVTRDISGMQIELLRMNRESWVRREVWANVIFTNSQIAELIDVGVPDFWITETIDSTRNAITKIERDLLGSDIVRYVSKIIDELPEDYAVHRESLRNLLARRLSES